MTPDVTLNFIANILLAVGMLIVFPIRRGLLKRAGLLAMSAAALINIVDMTSLNYTAVRPGELIVNCAMAYYVTVLIVEMEAHRKGRG